MKAYETSMEREFERINRRDVFRIGEKNFKKAKYKKVPMKIGSH